MTRSVSRDPTRDRLLSSVLLAVLLHALAFVALEIFLKLVPQRAPDYRGPIFVQLEEQPVVQQARQPTPASAAAAPAPSGQAGAGAASPAVSPAPAPAAAPQLPSGPPLRAAGPGGTASAPAAAPTGSPFRMEGATAQQGQPRPAGQGFQVPSSEPTLPPAGATGAGAVSPQGPPLRAVAPGETASARSAGQGPAVPLEEVDRALGSGAARQGAGAPGAGGGAQAGAGQGDTSREGISIVFDDPTRGREPTYTPLPAIPKWVSDAGLRLTLGISFELTPQGVLNKVKIEKSCGYSDVDWAVLVAVRRWKFKPAPAGAGNIQGTVGYLILPR